MYAIFPLYMLFIYSTLVTLKTAILHCFSTLPFQFLLAWTRLYIFKTQSLPNHL